MRRLLSITRCIFIYLIISVDCFAHPLLYSHEQWSLLGYAARMTTDDLRTILTPRKLHWGQGNLFAATLTYVPDGHFFLQRWFNYCYLQFEANVNAAYLYDENGQSAQLNPYLSFRFSLFPWNNYLKTTFASGDGIAIVSKPPYKEFTTYRYQPYQKSKFDNFFFMELTFALPKYDNLQLALIAHHRCPFFNVLDPRTHGASTAYGVGIRYYF